MPEDILEKGGRIYSAVIPVPLELNRLPKQVLVLPVPLAPPKPARLLDKQKKQPFFFKYGLLFFFLTIICYFELIFRLRVFGSLNADFIFPVLFALPSAMAAFLVSKIFSEKINKTAALLVVLFFALIYSFQLIYYYIFNIPFSLYSGFRAGYALQFWSFSLNVIFKNFIPLIFIILPFMFLILLREKVSFSRLKPVSICLVLFLGAVSYGFFIFGVNFARTGNFSQYALYYKIDSLELSVIKLGLLPTESMDVVRYFIEKGDYDAVAGTSSAVPEIPTPLENENTPPKSYNVTNIDFQGLIANENDPNILAMHEYFSSLPPTTKNDYTGILKGNNLIFIVAEAFSPYAISPDLTPNLYKMSREGFVFNDFYNPVWEVSTSDGEYVSDVGLLPKSGVWSMYTASKNYLPLALGNQFGKIGYSAKAYHNHTYTYYKRNFSIPNLGYVYKGVGNGLKVAPTWPESDLEMIENTTGEYLDSKQPFHVYYMTISGHLEYNFFGNYIAKKNKEHVDNLTYSDAAKAYLAANLELEFALDQLVQKLDEAGALENTAIAIVNDHYPYGLARESMNELAGHKIESNFELYKGVFILWKQGLAPVEINKPVSTLDILPTISNLFGLDYDSRLLMGSDVFSDTPPLVIFLNRSWITDKGKYDSTVKHEDSDYENAINALIADKFKYSKKVLETDYYRKILP